jgi:2-polyprenyl-3-methyl-5-hydroxy-6-metoxy-1,4-benzoquinol methylase
MHEDSMDSQDPRSPLLLSYLKGNLFSENMSFTFAFPVPVQDRIELLTELALGKRILHIGCCDHIALMRKKISAGRWLHGKLTEVATYCVGIDIDASAVAEARRLSKLSNIYHGDITGPDEIPVIGECVFDYVIFGEVLEHIGNPVSFLSAFLSNYRANVRKVVITVPNAFRAGNIQNIFRSREVINTDHRFFFTPYTLAKVASDAGLALSSIKMARYSNASLIKQAILNRFPLLAEVLVFIGDPCT